MRDRLTALFKKTIHYRPLHTLTISLLLAVLFLGMIALGEKVVFAERVYPNLKFGNLDLSYKSYDQAALMLQDRLTELDQEGLTLRYESRVWQAKLSEIGIALDHVRYLDQIKTHARTDAPLEDAATVLRFWLQGETLTPIIEFDHSEAYIAFIDTIATEIEQPQVNASLGFVDDAVQIFPERRGLNLPRGLISAQISQALTTLSSPVIDLTLIDTPARVTAEEVQPLVAAAASWAERTVHLTYELVDWKVSPADLKSWLSTAYDENTQAPRLTSNTEAGRTALLSLAETGLNRPPLDAVFELTDGKVSRFEPSQDGLVIDAESTLMRLDEALAGGQDQVEIAVLMSEPEIQTAEVNNLGIQERIGRGVSYFHGSSNARMTNIKNASSKLNGVIVPPHSEFSYNDSIGDVSTKNGFVIGLVIEKGRTVEGVGGGVCQPSTTMFRAALDAGYPITQRYPHAYRVHYYEEGGPGYESGKPGIDATVYSPSKDLRFMNDTDNSILILTDFDRANYRLTIDLYSTPTGRQVEISEPRVFNITAAPAPEYYDVPSQPIGYLKQIDWAAGGADTEFTRTIVFPDSTSTVETYTSHYKAWSAKYERGTGGVNPQESPPTEEQIIVTD